MKMSYDMGKVTLWAYSQENICTRNTMAKRKAKKEPQRAGLWLADATGGLCWVEHPLGFRFEGEKSPGGRVIVGTAVEVLHRLWERHEDERPARWLPRTLQPTPQSWSTRCVSHSFLILRFPWQPTHENHQENGFFMKVALTDLCAKGNNGEIKAKIPVVIETKSGNLVTSVQAEEMWAQAVSLMNTFAALCFQATWNARKKWVLMICLKCLTQCLSWSKPPPWSSGSQLWLHMGIT